jgi:spore coat protein U-like protein
MKRNFVAPLTAGILLALAGTAQAATRTTTFNVSASVIDNCVISVSDLAFGTFDGTANLQSTSTVTLRCSSGTDYTVDLSAGSSGNVTARTMTSATSSVPLRYNLYTDAAPYTTVWANGLSGTGRASGLGSGMGTPITHTVYGFLALADNLGQIDAGSFNDVITATITY